MMWNQFKFESHHHLTTSLLNSLDYLNVALQKGTSQVYITAHISVIYFTSEFTKHLIAYNYITFLVIAKIELYHTVLSYGYWLVLETHFTRRGPVKTAVKFTPTV